MTLLEKNQNISELSRGFLKLKIEAQRLGAEIILDFIENLKKRLKDETTLDLPLGVKYVLQRDLNTIDQLDDRTWTTCLNIALYFSQSDFLQMERIIEAVLDYQEHYTIEVDDIGQNPYHFAVMSGDPTLLEKLCTTLLQSDITASNKQGNTALHYAVAVASPTKEAYPVEIKQQLIEILLQHVSPESKNDFINYRNMQQETAADCARQLGLPGIAALLRQHGADLPNLQECTALPKPAKVQHTKAWVRPHIVQSRTLNLWRLFSSSVSGDSAAQTSLKKP